MKKNTHLTTELEKIRKKLRTEYPPYHWKHCQVFTAFWQLYDAVMKN